MADLHAAQWGTEFDLVGLVLHVGEVFHGAPYAVSIAPPYPRKRMNLSTLNRDDDTARLFVFLPADVVRVPSVPCTSCMPFTG